MTSKPARCCFIVASVLSLSNQDLVAAFSVPSHPKFSPATALPTLNHEPIRRTPALRRQFLGPSRTSPRFSSAGGGGTKDDVLIQTSNALRRTSWISWWSQVILTTVSSVILLFARNIGMAAASKDPSRTSNSFFFAGTGITLSVMSVLWTWGGARLSRRLLRDGTSRISAANLTRRAVRVGASINLLGMFVTLIGAFVVVGELATKVLTTQGLTPFGAAGAAAAGAAAQTIQPLDILVVQANANTLLSHFASLFFALFLTRFVDRLDPPSTEDDPRD